MYAFKKDEYCYTFYIEKWIEKLCYKTTFIWYTYHFTLLYMFCTVVMFFWFVIEAHIHFTQAINQSLFLTDYGPENIQIKKDYSGYAKLCRHFKTIPTLDADM